MPTPIPETELYIVSIHQQNLNTEDPGATHRHIVAAKNEDEVRRFFDRYVERENAHPDYSVQMIGEIPTIPIHGVDGTKFTLTTQPVPRIDLEKVIRESRLPD